MVGLISGLCHGGCPLPGLAQDLAVAPMLLVVDGLSGEAFQFSIIFKIVLSIGLLAAATLYLSRRRHVNLPLIAVTVGSVDLTPVAALTWCFGFAAIAGIVGLSPAFGAFFAGLLIDPEDVVSTTFDEGHDEIVIVRDIPFASICEHHLVPFVGRAHVGYLPGHDGLITGLSKLARLVDVVAKRPNLQERITAEVADTLERVLKPRGVIVQIEAEHFCMTMRGVRKPGAMTVTSAVRGTIREDARTRAEVMSLIGGPRVSSYGP